ncbi:hypothetical protein [Actinomadura livida]|uniref:Asp-tRNA(Asn)/Glu-tRNA(Gln) amidotransferase A subunit family amidase n=1 Tax=Actinomadura livida TaxID=79909 RepID=A0A7W7IDT9_9ACTN|nr:MULTISPECIES: hypothetical protein [Actinomadura]MBB4774888.1 Asp-tRNA(Asn)/Glu-tRNA(Gln) amidotransferase A subunit family amidase [Actinomadura catellatispora]GGU05362.1 hypothetical protein GCM10010208_31850 [Actinomadura livida]
MPPPAPSLDHLGMLAGTVDDAALLVSAFAAPPEPHPGGGAVLGAARLVERLVPRPPFPCDAGS